MRCSKKDIPRVNYIMSQDGIFQNSVDDRYPVEKRYQMGRLVLSDPRNWVLMPNDNCVFVAVPVDDTVFDVHVAVTEEGRGLEAVKAARAAIDWFFEHNEEAGCLIGFTPAENRAAVLFARVTGFKRVGVLFNSFLKDGRYQDQIISGLSREV